MGNNEKVLVICLDGYEDSLGEEMMAQGELPSLTKLKSSSAHMRLDHGPAQRTGLAMEHVASGMSPEDANRWAAVSFNPTNYDVWQEGTKQTPFTNYIKAKTVVFDAAYFDLRRTPKVEGIVNWGAHDPGIATNSNPSDLLAEFNERFGEYPAKGCLYEIPWPSPKACQRTGDRLTEAVDIRTEGSLWLLKERLPDWDLGIVVVSEPHSAIEALWHGVDPTHPLHILPSAESAGEGLRSVYRAIDRLISRLTETFSDARVVVFSMGGMGPNRSDSASMVLLSELLYRNAFGTNLMQQRRDWIDAPNGIPILKPGENWSQTIHDLIPHNSAESMSYQNQLRKRITPFIPIPIKKVLRTVLDTVGQAGKKLRSANIKPVTSSLNWMPTTLYQSYWKKMPAFALPSFYDGRIRINLKGREQDGMINPTHYHNMCDEMETLLNECRDPVTGESVVDFIERPAGNRNPLTMGPTECDLVVVWKGPLALNHPRLGQIGPIPYRRSGGHTGPHGMAYISRSTLPLGDYGIHSAFDIVPTIIELLGEHAVEHLSGSGLLGTNKPEKKAANAG